MQLIIWGIGRYYTNRKDELADYLQTEKINIAAFCDSNRELWGQRIDGIQVLSPDEIQKIHFDAVLVMSSHAKEIELLLFKLGIGHEKILFWELFRAKILQGKRKIYKGIHNEGKNVYKQILIISTALSYAGGQLAAVYAAKVLQDREYGVVLAAPGGEENFIKEMTGQGITVMIWPSLPYIYNEDKEWIKQFDVVIVNTFVMLASACRCAVIRPTMWWIHEAMEYYAREMAKPWNCIAKDDLNKLAVYAVSRLAKDNFNTFIHEGIKGILPYGIPDMAPKKDAVIKGKTKIIFAVIGEICDRKAQDVFIEAACQLGCMGKAEFWVIGKLGNDAFGKKIQEMVSGKPFIRLWGVLTRKDIYKVLQDVDVVVCTSREDPLPIVVTEGMMLGKICIITDKTGNVDYIRNGDNGFVVSANNVKVLKEKMEWIICNYDEIRETGIHARETYEKNFSMDVFGNNLERVLNEIELNYQGGILDDI